MKTYNLGILGCGDFLRWQEDSLKQSSHVRVKALFDPDVARAESYAAKLGGSAVRSEAAIFSDPEIDIVCLFTPPWLRQAQVAAAAAAGKQILTVKPLAPSVAACDAMVETVQAAGVRCGVMYRRTGDAVTETLKRVLDSGEIGALALFKEDWLHHYPQWNTWALDPAKNGGPFMDAMIHNLNIAGYLMGKPVQSAFFSSLNLAHPGLTCNDTEFLLTEYAGGGAAHLFITWAADLQVYNTEGNNREHIDIFYLITDKGWRVTVEPVDEQQMVVASREGVRKQWPVQPLPDSIFDRFALALERGVALPSDLPDITEAAGDIRVLLTAQAAR